MNNDSTYFQIIKNHFDMQLKDLLKNQGYLTIALPADDIEPQQILVKDNNGGLKRLPDKVYKLFRSDENALPTTKKNATVTNISGSVVTHSEAKVSFGFLEALVKKIGIELSFNVDRTSDDQLVFMFESPKKDEISSFVDLDSFLNTAVLNEGTYSDMLKDNDIYIITAVLKSANFTIGLVDADKLSTALTLPSIQEFVDAKITAAKDSDHKRVIEYKGDKELVFGVQAVRVLYERTFGQKLTGKKGLFRVVNTEGVIVRDDEDTKVTLLNGNSLILGL